MSTKQDHKRWRKQFNEDCLRRDKNCCVFCKVTDKLDVHHITDRHDLPNGGYVLSNGITLCEEHHLMAEEYHMAIISEEPIEWDNLPFGFSPIDLYLKINSSFEQALSDSEKLK